MMDNPEYVCICIAPNKKAVAICPCDENNKDAIRLKSSRDGEIYSLRLFDELVSLRPDFRLDRSYRITGAVSETKIAEFFISDESSIEEIDICEKERTGEQDELRT